MQSIWLAMSLSYSFFPQCRGWSLSVHTADGTGGIRAKKATTQTWGLFLYICCFYACCLNFPRSSYNLQKYYHHLSGINQFIIYCTVLYMRTGRKTIDSIKQRRDFEKDDLSDFGYRCEDGDDLIRANKQSMFRRHKGIKGIPA
jgi:hypothetical protein